VRSLYWLAMRGVTARTQAWARSVSFIPEETT
jgi:hypothetical protein